MNHLQQQTLENIELVLTDKEHNYLGPDLVLKRCRVIFRTRARGLTMTKVKFLDCQFGAKKKLVSFDMWCGTELQGCTFTGRYDGNSFGHWEDNYSNGSIQDCDFSGAILDGCQFVDCDIESIKLPVWPCFTIVNPHQHQAELESTRWPGKLEHWFGGLSWSPEQTVAVVGYAPELVKRSGGSVEELRNILKTMSGVLM